MIYEYDAVVVGAGNGGLTAAATLCREGIRTVLLEKHNLPGGVASSFVRGRFEFEASLHELCGVGTADSPGSVRKLFSKLGADADFINEKNLFRTIVTGQDGYDVTLESGWDAFRASFVRACPGAGKSLDRLEKLFRRTDEALRYNDKKKGRPNKLVMMMKYGKFLISASHPLDDVLRYLGFSLRERLILETYWSYLGVPADELNAFHYFEMLKGYIDGGAGIPTHKSYGLSLSLSDVILKNGGEIRYNTEVTGFIYGADGRVTGVYAGGDEYRAKHVISNVIPNNVFEMSDLKHVPRKDRKLVNARKLGISFICIYLGLDRTAEELGIKDYSVFIAHRQSSRGQADADMGMYVVNCLNVAVPEATPEGTCSLFFTVPVFSNGMMKNVTPENYAAFKSETARKYIEDYEKTLGVSIKDSIEEISVSTPATFARYFGAPNGTAYGYELSGWDGVMARTLSLGSELDIKGLSFCGGHSASGDGFGVSYESGVKAAEKAIADIRGDRGK